MVTIEIEIDNFIEMLCDRVKFWESQIGSATDVYESYYREYGDLYDNSIVETTIPEIVDNFIVNDTIIFYSEDDLLDEYGYETIEEAYDNGIIIYEYDGKYLCSTHS